MKCLGTGANNVCHATEMIGEQNHLKEVFQANGYPAKMVNWTLRNRPTNPSPLPTLFHPNRRTGEDHPQVPPLIICERCQRGDREEVQETWHQDKLEIEGNPQGSLGASKRPSARVEKESSHVPDIHTMHWMQECLHWGHRKKTGEEDKWTQRSSEGTWCEKRHCSTCMDQAAQGGLASSDSQACMLCLCMFFSSLSWSGFSVHSKKNSQACGDQPLKRTTIEALCIHLQRETSNLDCGSTLCPVWHPLYWTPLSLLGHTHLNASTNCILSSCMNNSILFMSYIIYCHIYL